MYFYNKIYNKMLNWIANKERSSERKSGQYGANFAAEEKERPFAMIVRHRVICIWQFYSFG